MFALHPTNRACGQHNGKIGWDNKSPLANSCGRGSNQFLFRNLKQFGRTLSRLCSVGLQMFGVETKYSKWFEVIAPSSSHGELLTICGLVAISMKKGGSIQHMSWRCRKELEQESYPNCQRFPKLQIWL